MGAGMGAGMCCCVRDAIGCVTYPCGGRDWLILFEVWVACEGYVVVTGVLCVILLLCRDFKISLLKLVDTEGPCFFNVFVLLLCFSFLF